MHAGPRLLGPLCVGGLAVAACALLYSSRGSSVNVGTNKRRNEAAVSSGLPRLRCAVCGEACVDMEGHLYQRHEKCDFCHTWWYNADAVVRHWKSCSNKKRENETKPRSAIGKSFACRHCGKQFGSLSATQRHEIAKHRAHHCGVCQCWFASADAFEQHEDVKHWRFPCTHCDERFSTRHEKEQHENSEHSRYECEECDRHFATERSLEQHENAKHWRFPCTHCDERFLTRQEQEQHENDEHDQYQCEECDRHFATERALEQHEDAKHWRFPCTHCDERFLTRQEQKRHENDEHPREPPTVPVPTPGQWVLLADFDGKKSFGFFRCSSCRATWVSAHAQTEYKQACQRCDTWSHPVWMWKNTIRRVPGEQRSVREVDPLKHHDEERCEACHEGVCTAVGGVYHGS